MILRFFVYLKKQYRLDPRALSLMRIGIGLVLIADYLIRLSAVEAFYSDDGILPREALKTFEWNSSYYSLHTLSGSVYWQISLFSLALLSAFCILVGYYTQVNIFISWLLLISLHNRNGLINQSGDDLLRLLLFWSIFLPLSQHYTLTKKTGQVKKNKLFFFMANVGYALLIFSVYFFSALLKDSPEWKTEGSALYYALSLDQMVWPAGKLIYDYPGLLKCLTHIVYWSELLLPPLLFIPFWNSYFRSIAVVGIILLHLGIASCLFVGLFFIIGIVSAIGLLPEAVMNKLDPPLTKIFRYVKRVIPFPNFRLKQIKLLVLQQLNHNFYFRVIINSMLAFIICLELLWCISLLPYGKLGVSATFSNFALAFRLDQNWAMFAPGVYKEDGWYIYEALTKNGKKIDLNRNGEPVTYQKPKNILAGIANDRWRKFGESYRSGGRQPIRNYFCQYLFKKWQREHPEIKITHLSIIYMLEVSKARYEYVLPVKETLCTCTP